MITNHNLWYDSKPEPKVAWWILKDIQEKISIFQEL